MTQPSDTLGSIDVHDLEEIQAAVIKYLAAAGGEFGDDLAAELRASAVFSDKMELGIGIWDLTVQDGELRLVRRPTGEGMTRVLFYAVLRHQANTWEVERFGEEYLSGR